MGRSPGGSQAAPRGVGSNRCLLWRMISRDRSRREEAVRGERWDLQSPHCRQGLMVLWPVGSVTSSLGLSFLLSLWGGCRRE